MSPSCRPDPHQVHITVIKSPGINFAYAQLCAQKRPRRNWPNRKKCELWNDKDRLETYNLYPQRIKMFGTVFRTAPQPRTLRLYRSNYFFWYLPFISGIREVYSKRTVAYKKRDDRPGWSYYSQKDLVVEGESNQQRYLTHLRHTQQTSRNNNEPGTGSPSPCRTSSFRRINDFDTFVLNTPGYMSHSISYTEHPCTNDGYSPYVGGTVF